jgi:hypothetical protein
VHLVFEKYNYAHRLFLVFLKAEWANFFPVDSKATLPNETAHLHGEHAA